MLIRPTINVQVTYKDLRKKPQKSTPLNIRTNFMHLYIYLYFIFSASLLLKHVSKYCIISYHCRYFYYRELFISKDCTIIYYFFQYT
jgi:hypothetical protein